MPKSVIVLLGRAGDCINFLPIAKHLNDTEGEPPVWIIFKLFEPLLRGVSYVKSHPIVCDIRRVDIAMKMATAMNPDRIIKGQTFGKLYAGPRDRAHNFAAWNENGYGSHFNDLDGFKLVFDRRDKEREAALCARFISQDLPTMLLCVGCAKSAPFASHKIFTESIKRRWGNRFNVVDLCSIRSSRLYDLIGLMEKSALLVTVDSSPMHLATAAPSMKVISLAPDNPFLGAECRYVPLRRVRYGEALAMLPQIHGDIASVLG